MAARARRRQRKDGWQDDWVFEWEAGATDGQDFGDRTSLVNALRNRRIYMEASLRLLSDLVEVMAGSAARDQAPRGALTGDALESDYHLVRRAARSSPCLHRSLRLHHSGLEPIGHDADAHRILLGQERMVGAPLDALGLLLGAAIAAQFDEIAAVVTFASLRPTAHIWDGESCVATKAVADYDATLAALRAVAREHRASDGTPLMHVIVVANDGPRNIADGFRNPRRRLRQPDEDERGYDRIVFVAPELPKQAPRAWAALLAASVRNRDATARGVDPAGPYFCSFVTSLTESPEPARRELGIDPVDEELQTARRLRRERPGWRLQRDRCRLGLDLAAMRQRWADGPVRQRAAGTRSLLGDDGIRAAAYRWARAVTNRQVGVALSGGGAASFRLVPLLTALEGRVPIDIVSGVSGGSLIAAYYCHSQICGLRRVIDRRWALQAMILIALSKSAIVRGLVNHDLDAMDVANTPIRFVPLTTVLPERDPPRASVVTAGTLGDAVQMSGAAPVLFAPTTATMKDGERVRFSDGATAALIPARILKDWGADLVFAFNCLPGPPRSNPLDGMAAGRWLYQLPLTGRLIDLWVSAGYLAQRISREADEDSHVYFEPDPSPTFLLDSFWFVNAVSIADQSAHSPAVASAIEECAAWWERFRRWART